MKTFIGIDPDLEKSGIALMIDGQLKQLETLDFFDICEKLYCHAWNVPGSLVVIEAGWLIKKSNFHKAQGARRREKIAKNVGENHAAGKLIAQYCERRGIKYELLPPRGKVDAQNFRRITGWPGRTNQETRDAAMMIWGRQ